MKNPKPLNDHGLSPTTPGHPTPHTGRASFNANLGSPTHLVILRCPGLKLGGGGPFLHLLSCLACISPTTFGQHQAELVLLHPTTTVTPHVGTQPGCLG